MSYSSPSSLSILPEETSAVVLYTVQVQGSVSVPSSLVPLLLCGGGGSLVRRSEAALGPLPAPESGGLAMAEDLVCQSLQCQFLAPESGGMTTVEVFIPHSPFYEPQDAILADHQFDRGRQQVGLSLHFPALGIARWGRTCEPLPTLFAAEIENGGGGENGGGVGDDGYK